MVWKVLINPQSGNKKSIPKWKFIRSWFEQEKIPFHESVSRKRGDIQELTTQAIEGGYRYFLIFGGDGTMHEYVNGLLQFDLPTVQQITTALYPSGTGNDLARHWRIPSSWKSWQKYFLQRDSRCMDLGKIEFDSGVVFFINAAGLGLESLVVKSKERISSTQKWGKRSYLLETVRSIFRYNGCQVIIDGARCNKIWNLTLGNCRYLGNGFQLTPDASPLDGQLNCTLVKHLSRWIILKNVLYYFNGKISRLHYVSQEFCERLEVASGEGEVVWVEADGEICGQLPAKFSVLPGVLNLLV